MSEPVLMGDPAVARVPVEESGEPLVAVPGDVAVSPLKDDHEPHRGRAREGLVSRLVTAQLHLPDGVRLCWVEGHRDARLQASYFDSYRAELVAGDPRLDDESSYLLASRYISPPAIAPHVSGAAIDLTLCDPDGRELDLGTRVNATPEESDGRCYFDAEVRPEARAHRTMLAVALHEVGLVNYPTEWWHWSYGDRYWALVTGAPAAIYGPVLE